MKRNSFCLILIIILALGTILSAYAHPEQGMHDKELKSVILGENVTLYGEKKEKFQAIANAASLCIDQFSSNEEKRSKEALFNSLDEREHFSFSFNEIELQKGSDGKNVSAKTHRRYTHRGWNFADYPLKDLWKRRKKILTATVNKELFGVSSGILAEIPLIGGMVSEEEACNEQCEAFCKLVYYVHILGDFEEATSYTSEVQQLIPLVRHADPRTPALINELIDITAILFEGQEWTSSLLIGELNTIKSKAAKLPFAQNGAWTQEQFDEYHQCAVDVLKALQSYVPGMLKKTQFFKDAFWN